MQPNLVQYNCILLFPNARLDWICGQTLSIGTTKVDQEYSKYYTMIALNISRRETNGFSNKRIAVAEEVSSELGITIDAAELWAQYDNNKRNEVLRDCEKSNKNNVKLQ